MPRPDPQSIMEFGRELEAGGVGTGVGTGSVSVREVQLKVIVRFMLEYAVPEQVEHMVRIGIRHLDDE